MIALFMLLLCQIFNVFSWEILSKGRDGSKFDRLDCLCRDMGNVKLPIRIEDVRIENSVFHCNIYMNATDEIYPPIKYNIKIQKCSSKESLDTCEPFYSFQSNQYCKMISGGWKGFYEGFKPEFSCPIKKGVYVAKDAKFDLRALPLVPVSGLYFKFITNLTNLDTGENYACCVVETPLKFGKKT